MKHINITYNNKYTSTYIHGSLPDEMLLANIGIEEEGQVLV